MVDLHVADAMTEIFNIFKRCNKYIDETSPWVLAKDEAKQDRLAEVLYNLTEGICIGASLLQPFMPSTSEKILTQLNTSLRSIEELDVFGKYPSGNKVIEKPEILFARLDINQVLEEVEKKFAPKVDYPQVEAKEEITIDDFDKIQLRVGEILECKPVKKSKKLLVSQVRIGDEVRQIVSGISQYYKPEEMVGKKVTVVTNLKPCKLCGVESQGMILAASDDKGNLCVVSPEKDIIAGSEVC
jgi:methionyl-tRNA synthetase